MASPQIRRLVDALRSVLGEGQMNLHEPALGAHEATAVARCVESGFVSSAGPAVTAFEQHLERVTGSPHAVAVANGTVALQVALMLSGVEPGDEVLAPALTFAATANAIAHCGATPHFVEVEPTSLGVCPERLQARLRDIGRVKGGRLVNKTTGRRIAAVVPVHIFGHPCALPELLAVCREFDVPLIEDAAEALGSTASWGAAGTLGQIGILSFNGNKITTTGGGGAILTADSELAARARHLTTTAKVPHAWEYVHDQVGFNFRMPSINAALGDAQLARLDGFLGLKRLLAARYADAVGDLAWLRLHREPPGTRSNYWLQALILDTTAESSRNDVLVALNAAGLGSRPAWQPLHTLQHFADSPRDQLPVTESFCRRIINIPSGADACRAVCSDAAQRHSVAVDAEFIDDPRTASS